MAQVSAANAKGSSKSSVHAAINDAIGQVLGGTTPNHRYSLTVIVDGYEFNGEEFSASVRVLMLDLDQDHEDLYHELEKERNSREDQETSLANDMYAAVYAKTTFSSNDDESSTAEKIQGELEDTQDNPPEETTIIATPAMHEQLERETGIKPELSPHYQQKMQSESGDRPAPSPFGAGGGSGPKVDMGEAA